MAEAAAAGSSAMNPAAAGAARTTANLKPLACAGAVPSRPGKNFAQYPATTGKAKVQMASDIRIRLEAAGNAGEGSGPIVRCNCHAKSKHRAANPAKMGASHACPFLCFGPEGVTCQNRSKY